LTSQAFQEGLCFMKWVSWCNSQ